MSAGDEVCVCVDGFRPQFFRGMVVMDIRWLAGLVLPMVLCGLVRGDGELKAEFRNPPDSALPGV
ncbi:MAG: hypothetical protein ACYTBJ_27305 [Planctomycetota bacterium]|jgi:hypothetical protein